MNNLKKEIERLEKELLLCEMELMGEGIVDNNIPKDYRYWYVKDKLDKLKNENRKI